MIYLSNKRYISDGFKSFLDTIQRYKLLNVDDKNKLLAQHDLKKFSPEQISKIKKKLDLPDHTPSSDDSQKPELNLPKYIKNELDRIKKSSFGRKTFIKKERSIKGTSKFYYGIDPTKELEPVDITSELFSNQNETYSLISDLKEANRYEEVQKILEQSRPIPQHYLTDDFLDILSRAIEENLSNLERPVLVNEFSDYRAAYSMKRAAIKNLLVNKCIRNAFEETRLDKFIDSQPDVYKQRLNAPLPPEVLEPLVAFKGVVNYSFSPIKRLQDKLDGIKVLVDGIVSGDNDILSKLPEFTNKTKYPFNNYYGFSTSIPNEVTGSIKMGKPNNKDNIRYHNLQCVAHSLPKDPKYRSIITHSIKLLERSKGWDQLSKIKAINRLIDIYNNMSSSLYYSKVMEESIPINDPKGKVIKTLTRQQVFNKGLKYIPSLFRNHWNRVKRKN